MTEPVTGSGPRQQPWRRGAIGLSATELALVALALGMTVVALLSEAGSADVGVPALVALAAVGWLPLLVAPRWPLPALGVVVVGEALHVALVPLVAPVEFNSIPVATMVAAYLVAVRRNWRTAWAAGFAAAVILLTVGLLSRPSSDVAANMFALDLVLVATGAGVLLQSRQLRLLALERRAVAAEASREEEARRQVAAERLRMARELHDVVAHNLALVNAQSSVAEYLLRSDPEAAAKALHDISHHTREALDELRATVGLLREADEPDSPSDEAALMRPMPGLADLDDLVAAHRTAGGSVTLTIDGRPRPLPAISDLAAYRIVQEALTNSRKHAPGAAAQVRLQWGKGQLGLRIENDPPDGSLPHGRGPGTGHGILGMRERAAACGGTAEATPRPDGGFVVEAAIPIEATR